MVRTYLSGSDDWRRRSWLSTTSTNPLSTHPFNSQHHHSPPLRGSRLLRRPLEALSYQRYLRLLSQTVGAHIPSRLPPSYALTECCMSGCAFCVYDLYQESLDAYKTAVASVRASLTSMGVPMEQWPGNIRHDSERKSSPSIILSAFEEMERELKTRRKAEAQS
jgi:hypothetical protein